MNAEQMWDDVLEQLKLQMTRATFETALAGTSVLRSDDDELVIAAQNPMSVAWLDKRLRPQIQEAVAFVAGRQIDLTFVEQVDDETGQSQLVEEPVDVEEQREIEIRLRYFDPRDKGKVELSYYALMYWLPVLGPKSLCTWMVLKMFGEFPEPPSLATLADIIANGNKRRLTGRTVNGKYIEGAFDPLEKYGLAIVHFDEYGRLESIDALGKLPLLTPLQASELSRRRREAHARSLKQFGIDDSKWRQLSIPTLGGASPNADKYK